MAATPVETFVESLRSARTGSRDEAALLRAVRVGAVAFAASRRSWLTDAMCQPDREQGFGLYLLHEEEDHALAAFVVSWLPRRGTPPHDHGTWAVVVGLSGEEENTLWRRLDDRSQPGRARIEPVRTKTIGADQVIAMPEGVIHSLRNEGSATSVSLHVYGLHVNYTRRSKFDPGADTESAYRVSVSGEAAALGVAPPASLERPRAPVLCRRRLLAFTTASTSA